MSFVHQHAGRLRAWIHPEGLRPADLPSNPADWSAIAEAALEARLGGLVLDAARQQGITPPGCVRHDLERQSIAIAAMSAHFTRELQPALHALREAGIAVMLLKGAALSLGRGVASGERDVRVYERPDLRAMTDVDLFVRPAEARRAVAVLERAGCRRGAGLVREDFFPNWHYETELFSSGCDPVRIDLHARPLRPLRAARTLPDDALWDGAIDVTVGSAPAVIPSREAMLVHLCAHAAFHGCSRLLWLVDIARLAHRFSDVINWDRVTELARSWSLVPAVGRGLSAAAAALGPVCPAPVLAELGPRNGSWRDRLVLRTTPLDAGRPLRHLLVSLITTPDLRFRLGYLSAVLLPGQGHLAESYPHRHAGWRACATGLRAMRAVRRALHL